jgi:ParB family chromosome partitioning protein
MIAAPEKITLVDVEYVMPSRFQYRRTLTEEEIENLAASIRVHGVLQPVLMRPIEGRKYKGITHELVAGHRRWEAAKRAGLRFIPAIVRVLGDIESAEIALVENVQREDPDDWSTALGIKALMELHAAKGELLSEGKVARKLNKSTTYVSNHLKLLKLHPKLQEVAQRHNAVKSSLLKIQLVAHTEHLDLLIEDVENGASFKKIEGRVDRILADDELKKQSQRPPDAETAARTKENERTGGGNMSRGRQVTGNRAREAREESQRHVNSLESWVPLLSDADYEKIVVKFARRVLRGDLSR